MSASLTRRARAFAPCLLLLGGCTALVEVEDAPRCVAGIGVPDPCPEPWRCRDGRCVPCDPLDAEVCGNGRDDDCDGLVDEGVDLDGDGFATCALAQGAPVDCDDASARAWPGNVERCDGEDGDCDGVADDGAACPAGRICLGRRCVDPLECRTPHAARCGAEAVCDVAADPARCVPGTRCEAATCGAGTACDPVTGACVPSGRAADAPCVSDASCAGGAACVPAPEGGARCALACATDDDCGPTEVCWAALDGGRRCRAAAPLGLVIGPMMVGSCTEGRQCRSGVCDGGECVVRCGTRDDCLRLDAGAACGVAPTRGPGVVAACVAFGNATAPCTSDDGCASGACVAQLDGTARCARLCTTDSLCEGLACAPVRASVLEAHVTACRPPPAAGAGEPGEACRADADCRAGPCVGGACRARCARASDCTSPDRCRPVPSGEAVELACAPP